MQLIEDCSKTSETILLALTIAVERITSLRDESGSGRLKLSSRVFELTGLKYFSNDIFHVRVACLTLQIFQNFAGVKIW